MISIREVHYRLNDLDLVAHLAEPTAVGPWPAVLIGHDGIGLEEYQRQRAENLAAHGYVALAIDYYGGETFFNRPNAMLDRVLPLLADSDQMEQIGRAGIEILAALPSVDSDRVAGLGYGAGGLILLQLAKAGVQLKALALVHPALPDASPQDWAGVIGRILLCTGSDDPLCTPERILDLGRKLGGAGVDWRANIYGGAKHAFWASARSPDGAPIEGESHTMATVPGVGYHADHTPRAWRAILDLFSETLLSSRSRAKTPALQTSV